MAFKIMYAGNLSQTGLTVTAKIYDDEGSQVGTTVILTETPSTAIYTANVTQIINNTNFTLRYLVRFFNGSVLLGQKDIDIIYNKDADLVVSRSVDSLVYQVGEVFNDTNELQQRAFTTPSDISGVITEINENEAKIDTLGTNTGSSNADIQASLVKINDGVKKASLDIPHTENL